MKAWRVHSLQMPECAGITGAHTRGQAIAHCLEAAEDAGYSFPWASFRAVREPKYDTVCSALRRMSATVEYADLLLNTQATALPKEGSKP